MAKRRSPRHELTVFDKHWLAIARRTLKMPDAMAKVMGGMSKMEAREIVRELTGAKPGEEGENPRRRRALRFGRTIKTRPVRIGRVRVTRRAKRNPAAGTRSEMQAWEKVRAYANQIMRARESAADFQDAHNIATIATEMVFQLRRGVHVNPRRFGRNPMTRKDFEYMAAVIADAQLKGMPVNVLTALTDFAVDLGKRSNVRFDADRFARRILQLVKEERPYRYVNNPALAVVGANPRGHPLGRVVEVRYHRKGGSHPGYYKHHFKSRPRLLAMPDGSLHIC